jgi:hypothetical protein
LSARLIDDFSYRDIVWTIFLSQSDRSVIERNFQHSPASPEAIH